MIKTGGNMRKAIKKSPKRKHTLTEVESTVLQLTDSQRQLLRIIATGTIIEEPSLLAGCPDFQR
jgi:hypothetical protein